MNRRAFSFLLLGGAVVGGIFLLVNMPSRTAFTLSAENEEKTTSPVISATSTPPTPKAVASASATDIENQKPLANPPQVVKAAYSTSWTAGTPSRIDALINLIKQTELNAVVIDIKDYSGYTAYDIQNDQVKKYGATDVRIRNVNALIKELHDNGIYAIARVTVFQDPILAKARPDLAIKSKSHGGAAWKDRKGLAWIDPAAHDAWDYNIAIAQDAAARGFDEINFDYIRFASDGDLSDMQFPFYSPAQMGAKHVVIAEFFKYLRSHLSGVKISADLFGLATVNSDDLGIGQVIEDAYRSFDYVSPMVYPSHYAVGFLGYKNPAQYPYEIVKYSMEHARNRLFRLANPPATATSTQTTPTDEQLSHFAKLRPWLQDFDLGATYDAAKVRAQMQAINDAGLHDGWMLWDPRNEYTRGALQ